MAFKKKHATLNGCISKSRANSDSKLTFSESSFHFLQNKIVFCTLYPRGYTAGGSVPLKPPVSLPAIRRAQRVSYEPIKLLNLLFFAYFVWKWGETLEKLHFFTFGPEQCFYLTHSAWEYLEKVAFGEK